MPTENATTTVDRHREWKLLLAGVERLHDRGFTGIRAIPAFAPVGYWRFHATTAVNLPGGVSFPPRDDDAMFSVTEASFPQVGSLRIDPDTSADEVADEILRSLGSPTECTYFNDVEYCEWFSRMRRRAEELGDPPSAFGDFQSTWRCGAIEIEPPPGWNKV